MSTVEAAKPPQIDFAAIPQTALKILTAPAEFFATMPKTGGFVEPLVFAVVMGVVGGLLQAVITLLGLNPLAGMAAGVAAVIMVPVMVAIFSFVGAAILYVIWMLLGSKESYETAYRCGAYICVLSPIQVVIGLVPYLGPIVGTGLAVWYLVMASVNVHAIEEKKAWIVFGIIGVLLVFGQISAQMAAKSMHDNAQLYQQQMMEQAERMRGQ